MIAVRIGAGTAAAAPYPATNVMLTASSRE